MNASRARKKRASTGRVIIAPSPFDPQTYEETTIYTDGACRRNPGRGGYGVLMRCAGYERELSGGFSKTTSSRMELMAVIVGLEAVRSSGPIIVYSDSRYIVNAVNKGWAKRWKAHGWMRNQRDRALNPDLWQRLLNLLEERPAELRWVEGTFQRPRKRAGRCLGAPCGERREPEGRCRLQESETASQAETSS